MKHYPALILAFFCTLSSIAQNFETGPLYTSQSKVYDPTIVGHDEDNFYLVEYINGGYIFEAFSKSNFKRKYSKDIILKEEREKKFQIQYLTYAQGKLVLFASHYSKSRKASFIYAYTFDGQTGMKVGNKTDLLTIDDSKRVGRLSWEKSKDGSKILLGNEVYNKDQNQTFVNYILLNNDLEELGSKEIVLDGKQNELDTRGVVIDNQGSVYSVSYNSKGFEIVSLDAEKDFERWSEKAEIKNLDVGEFLNSSSVGINDNDEVISIGYYSDEENNLLGYTYIKVDPYTKEIVDQKKLEFPEGFADQFKTQKDYKKKKDGTINGNFSNRMYHLDDGSILFIGEAQSLIRSYTNNALTAEYYRYGDMIVAKFDKDGNSEWINKISKNQLYYWANSFGLKAHSGGVGFGKGAELKRHYSYIPYISENKLHIVYHENKANLIAKNKYETYEMDKPKKSIVAMQTIDLETGDIEEEQIEKSTANAKMMLVPGSSNQPDLDEDVFLMIANKKSFKFGKLEF